MGSNFMPRELRIWNKKILINIYQLKGAEHEFNHANTQITESEL